MHNGFIFFFKKIAIILGEDFLVFLHKSLLFFSFIISGGFTSMFVFAPVRTPTNDKAWHESAGFYFIHNLSSIFIILALSMSNIIVQK